MIRSREEGRTLHGFTSESPFGSDEHVGVQLGVQESLCVYRVGVMVCCLQARDVPVCHIEIHVRLPR